MSHRLILSMIVIAVAYLVLPSSSFAQPYGYEGTQVCGMCHKTEKQGQQLKIWQDSKHADAYKTLLTEKANKISGSVKAAENPNCLKCHASGHGVDAKLLGAKFKMEDGVQCETCHGAGSAYKAMKVMKVKADAIKNGMTADPEKQCVSCHNADSPTYDKAKPFNYKEMWAKIAHPVPKG